MNGYSLLDLYEQDIKSLSFIILVLSVTEKSIPEYILLVAIALIEYFQLYKDIF